MSIFIKKLGGSIVDQQKSYVMPLVGALLGIILSGAIWGGIAIATDYEVGYVAIATGALTGFLVAVFAKRKVNAIHQLYAVIASLIGILLGKYIAISYAANDMFGLGYFDQEVMTLFEDHIMNGLEPMNYLFFGLAVVIAWQVTKSTSVKAKQQEEGPSVPQ